MCLDLTPGAGDLLGRPYWEINSAWLGECWTLNSGESPRDAAASSLSQILEGSPHPKYYLSRTACQGILRRALREHFPKRGIEVGQGHLVYPFSHRLLSSPLRYAPG